MKYRSRTDIIAQILESANGGATKTKITYRAFISYAQLVEYLVLMTSNGLLQHDATTQTFKTTEKGLRFSKIYNQIGKLVLPVNEIEE